MVIPYRSTAGATNTWGNLHVSHRNFDILLCAFFIPPFGPPVVTICSSKKCCAAISFSPGPCKVTSYSMVDPPMSVLKSNHYTIPGLDTPVSMRPRAVHTAAAAEFHPANQKLYMYYSNILLWSPPSTYCCSSGWRARVVAASETFHVRVGLSHNRLTHSVR